MHKSHYALPSYTCVRRFFNGLQTTTSVRHDGMDPGSLKKSLIQTPKKRACLKTAARKIRTCLNWFLCVRDHWKPYNGLGVAVSASVRVFTAGPVPRVRLMGHWLTNSSNAAPVPSSGLTELPSIMHAARQGQVKILLWALAVFGYSLTGSGWASEPVQTFRRRGKSLTTPAIRTPDHPTCSLISIPITLSRFRTPIGYVTENNCRRSKHVRDLALGPTVLTYSSLALRISWISDGRGKSHKSVTDIGDGGTFTHQRHLWYTLYTISCKYTVHTLSTSQVGRGGVWGWQVGLPPQPLLRGPRASGLWICQAIFSGELEMLIHAPFKNPSSRSNFVV